MRRSTLPAALLAFAAFALPASKEATNLESIDAAAIDRSCKPCDDFYQFAIGEWHARNPIPASQPRWGKRWAAADGNLEVLRGIADGIARKGTGVKETEALIGAFYGSCMDTGSIDAAGVRPVLPALQRIARISSVEQVNAEIARLAGEGLDVPLRVSPVPFSEDPTRAIAAIGGGTQGLPDRDYYLKPDARSKETRERYLAYIHTLFRLSGLEEGRAAAVLELEAKLARAQMSRVEYRNPYKVTNNMRPAEVRALAPRFDWDGGFAALGVPFSGILTVRDPGLVREVGRQLSETPVEDWKAYLEWHVLRHSAPYLSEGFRKAAYEFEEAYLEGRKEPRPRWKVCVSMTDASLGDALGKAYAEKMFPPAAKARMQELVKNLRAALEDGIRGLEWMTPETKEKALAKLATFDPKVGYPDRWRIYDGEPLDRSDFFGNVMRAGRYLARDRVSQIGKPVDRTRWGMTVPTSNAYYSAPRNEIVFPAGILIPPMFRADADDAVNYGAIGVVIGHEISHGYDDQGSQYDAQGRLKNWWTDEDRRRFLDRAQCVVDQFEGYFIEDGVHHNGKLVLGESIGDLAGARIAYAAFRKSLEGKPRPKDKDGFTPEQRFFLSWAQARGDSTRIEEQRKMVVADPHPVAKFRVIGPLANMPEFHQAFACKRGDAMVRPPEKQCRIW